MKNQRFVSFGTLFLMIFPAFCGCMESDSEDSFNLEFSVSNLVGGEVQTLRITSTSSMSVLVPYLVLNPDTSYVQNGTILDFDSAYSSHTFQILVPPSSEECIF